MLQAFNRHFLALLTFVLAAHVAVFLAKLRGEAFTMAMRGPTHAPRAVTVRPLTGEQWKKHLERVKERQQIVQNDNTGHAEKPKDQAFLGERDQRHDRQTVARRVDVFNKAGRGNSFKNTDGRKVHAEKVQRSHRKQLKDMKMSDLGLAASMPAIERTQAKFGEQGITDGDVNSRGLSSTNDYVEHVKLGDFTQLNTVEYKYYGFFHRIRQKLEQFWGRSIREKTEALWKAGRRLPASENYTTGLVITMDGDGTILRVQVKNASGVRELDEAAVESFNKAGPFPNPPRGLVVDGKATIEWGFVVVNS